MSIETYGDYQLLKRLATGGMAQIYLARRAGLEGFEKLVVVKRILPHLAENEEFVKMFLDEARIAARLNHPNIVQIFDLGALDDTFFIAMEYIHGEDARRVWKRADAVGKSMPVALVCRVIMDACSGLDYAHKRTDAEGKPFSIVHRDISPQNILVSFQGGVKVVDFGIAKAADQATVTRSGVLKGKYSYMSPEQASGKKVDCRTDIFALGVVLYELLTGTRLFKRGNDIQTLNAVTECQVAPPSEVNSRLPADLDALVMKALAREPSDRYQQAVHLQVSLEDWLLRHQLPSSSAHLAAFMQELYSDRLAREEQEGGVLVEDSDGSREEAPKRERATPSVRSSSRATSGSVKAAARSRTPDATLAERPEKARSASGARRGLEVAFGGDEERLPQPTEMSRTLTSRRWPLLAVASVAVSSIAVLGFLLLRQGGALGSRAVVQLSSEPSGATVVFNGAPLPELTPCTLPKVPAGSYPIRVGKVGYLDHQGTVDVPSSGEVRLPPIKLLPDRPPPPEPQVSLRVASTLPAEVSVDGEPVGQTPLEIQVAPGRRKLALLVQTGERSECEVIAQGGRPVSLSWAGGGCREGDPSSVMLTVRSQPHGAELYVDGLAQGQTPLTVEVEPKRELSIRLELAGYKLAERRVETGLGAPRELSVELERRGQSSVKVVDRRDPPKASGLVRFAVTPWAEVACGGHDFGPTPFKDRSLPVGEYECRFTHPELGTRTERVVVRANETSRVTVKF